MTPPLTPATTPSTTRTVLVVRGSTANPVHLVTVEVLAHDAGLHPELVRRLIALGGVEADGGTTENPTYPGDAAARLARIMRLRRDLGVNYAGAILAADLLQRIDALQELLTRYDDRH